MAHRVLIIDDDARIAASLGRYFEREGFAVETVYDGAAALESAARHAPDLVLLDLSLPDVDGIDICRRLRASGDAAILMVTARTTLDDRLRGLDVGADDYITKPFSPREVVARAQAVLRRTRPASGRLRFGSLQIDTHARTVRVDGALRDLTPTEFAILAALAAAPRTVFTRSALIERALGWDYAGRERTIDTHVTNLRGKLGPAGKAIATVFAVGYRFDPPS